MTKDSKYGELSILAHSCFPTLCGKNEHSEDIDSQETEEGKIQEDSQKQGNDDDVSLVT